jgi:AraC-like DNA-binding protein
MKISHRQDEYMYSYVKGNPPDKLKMHLHNYYEFLYFISGDASYIVENNIYHIDKGDIFVTRPGELHTITFHSNALYERCFIQISRDFLSEFNLFDRLDSQPLGQHNRIPASIVNEYALPDYFNNVGRYVTHRVSESDAMIKSYFIQFLVTLNSIGVSSAEKPARPSDKHHSRIDDIIDFLTDNITPDITLDFLSEKFFINKYYMCHAFKDKTGLTIKEFTNTRKITRAKNLLSRGADITRLCYDCGFNDYSTFYKTFKKLTGKSPKAFMKGN